MVPSIKYVTLFFLILTSLPLSHFITHPGISPKYVTHLRPPIFLVGLVQKTRTKAPCTNSLSNVRGSFCSGGFCLGVFCLESFVRGGFCPFPLLSEYIRYNSKLNIIFNFRFHMYEFFFKSVTSHALGPPPPVTNCHTFSDPPSSVTYFMEGPFGVVHVIVILT